VVTLLPLNEIEDEFWCLWPGDKEVKGRRLILLEVVSESQSNLYDETGNSLEQDNDDCHLGKDPGVFYTPDFGFSEDGEVVFCRGIGPLSS